MPDEGSTELLALPIGCAHTESGDIPTPVSEGPTDTEKVSEVPAGHCWK
jgi:hypothetical protein